MNVPECILSLNIRSGGGARVSNLLSYVDQRRPPVIVLTEWRANPVGRGFVAWAETRGMQTAVQNDGQTANGVLVASVLPFKAETVTPDGSGAGTLMLAKFAAFDLLACYFPQKKAKSPFFARCSEIVCLSKSTPMLLIGDLNTGNQDRDTSDEKGRFFCSNAFDELTTCQELIDLWRRSNGDDAREWTWLSNHKNGFRIDHALANEAFVALADPVCFYDHEPRERGWTDHSAVVVSQGNSRSPSRPPPHPAPA